MQNLRQISFNGGVRYQKQFDDVADADEGYEKIQAKQTHECETIDTGKVDDNGEAITRQRRTGNMIPFLPEHTVEDVVSPEVAKRLTFKNNLEKIKDPDDTVSKQAIYEILRFLGKDHFDDD